MSDSATKLLITRDGESRAHVYGPMGILCRSMPNHLSEPVELTRAGLMAEKHCAVCAKRLGITADRQLF